MDRSHDLYKVPNVSIAHMALTYPSARLVFSKYEIDFCCDGEQLFEHACERVGVVPGYVWREIQSMEVNENPENLRVHDWNPVFLVDFIVQNHHAYAQEMMPKIKASLLALCDEHDADHIELAEVLDDFNDLVDEITHQVHREELALFPVIRRLYKTEVYTDDEENPVREHVQASITRIEAEHKLVDELLRSLRKLTNFYTAPENASTEHTRVYQKLAEFDTNTTMHIFLENNVLFKKLLGESLHGRQ